MATHVLCLDGTNQQLIQPAPTNIALLYHALGGAPVPADAGSFESINAQPGVNGKYLPGVGAVGQPGLRALGNLFGDGIAEPIIRGYTFLSRTYRPGDTIIITGFSRGATAARSLAGIIAVRGLLDPARYDVTDKNLAYRRAVAAWYKYRSNKPDLANQARLHWLGSVMGDIPTLTDADFTPAAEIAAVGVFDTVSSLGVPHLDFSGDAVFDFSICDTALNAHVRNGFHALAADELRELFAPTLWADRAGIIQELFPGAHSDVGGGYPESKLSDCALMWMSDQLNGEAPSLFDLSRCPRRITPDPLAPAHDESMVFPFIATPRRARAFPHITKPSDTLKRRFNQDVDVLPGLVFGPYSPKARYADGTEVLT